jgi:hypothetical protein
MVRSDRLTQAPTKKKKKYIPLVPTVTVHVYVVRLDHDQDGETERPHSKNSIASSDLVPVIAKQPKR